MVQSAAGAAGAEAAEAQRRRGTEALKRCRSVDRGAGAEEVQGSVEEVKR